MDLPFNSYKVQGYTRTYKFFEEFTTSKRTIYNH